MARLWAPRVSPRCTHKFHGGGKVFHGGNIWETRGAGGPTAGAPEPRVSHSSAAAAHGRQRYCAAGPV